MTSRRNVTPPLMCMACKGAGVVPGVCMDLTCLECDGIGWLPTPGQDLTIQLGKALVQTKQINRLLEARLPPTDERSLYQNNKRGGARGNYTGD